MGVWLGNDSSMRANRSRFAGSKSQSSGMLAVVPAMLPCTLGSESLGDEGGDSTGESGMSVGESLRVLAIFIRMLGLSFEVRDFRFLCGVRVFGLPLSSIEVLGVGVSFIDVEGKVKLFDVVLSIFGIR